MALTIHKASSSSSSASNSIPKWNFHVFLSFRGEDTRKGFIDHLYAALCRKGIKAFRDDDELERGEVISPKLIQAIEGSLFAIVVLSKNYASSSWCLDELQNIMASRKEVGQQVFPIFYGVDPSDVRHQKGSFAQAFIKHMERSRGDKEKVQKWRDSLTEIANLSGWSSEDQLEAELIEKVIEELWSKLRHKLPPYDAKLVGIDSKIDEIDSLLRVGLNDVCFVGIWGMGGVGKTTLAKAIYNRLLDQFEICCFLSNVREAFERYNGLVDLQTKLLSCLKIKGMVIEETYEGKRTIRNLFSNNKVLLVLDDVSSIYQLENLIESKEWFGAGSRVIITTRNMHLLISHGVHEIYKVHILNEEESLQLFSSRAFKTDKPKKGYLALSESVIKYAGGLPLALEVLGNLLCERSMSQWEDTLKMLKQYPNSDIHKILRISYDGLGDDEKTIFLDIACFFESLVDKDEVTQILEFCGLFPRIGIGLLVEKSLLSETVIGDRTYIDMHDLIQEMGRSIVIQEFPNDPGKRTRLWSSKDIDKVLKKNMGTEMIQGIILPKNSHIAYCDREAFSKMINLRLLMISCDLKLPYTLECLSSALRVLQWDAYPLEDLPLGTQLNKLAFLQLRYGNIKHLWDDRQCFESLKFMDLSHSNCLFNTPNFAGVPNLERLILKDCIGLVEVHSSLGQLKNLLVVNLKGCRNLRVLPRKFEMDSLKEFVLFGCTQVKKLPEFGEYMKNLETLDLRKTGIAKLPDSLGFLTHMEVLNLKGCKNLVCLPYTFQNLKHLKILNIYGCLKFSKLPENLNENEALEEFDASETAIMEVPSSIGQLEKLKMLSFHPCKRLTSNSSWIFSLLWSKIFKRYPFPKDIMLPPSIFNMKSLTELNLSYCNIDEGFFPNDLGGLLSLQKLNLSRNKFVILPASIFNLKSLRELNLGFCNIEEFRFIHDDLHRLSSLQSLNLSGNSFVNVPTACNSNFLQIGCFHLRPYQRLQSLPHRSPSLCEVVIYECASTKPLSDQQLSHFFASFYQDGQSLNKELSFSMSGSKIPSLFKYQTNITLHESKELLGVYCGSIIIDDVPPCELLGYAWCVVLKAEVLPHCYWRLLEDPECSPPMQFYYGIDSWYKFFDQHNTWILFRKPLWQCRRLLFEFEISNKKEWEYNKKEWESNEEEREFDEEEREPPEAYSLKCGWRFIGKEDMEELGRTMSGCCQRWERTRMEKTDCAVKGEKQGQGKLVESSKQVLTDDASVIHTIPPLKTYARKRKRQKDTVAAREE